MNGPAEQEKPRNLHVIDLTHTISTKTPSWEGDTGEYRYEKLTSVGKDGYFTGAFRIPEHFGTHMDAPAHFAEGETTIDKLPPEKLILPAVVIDVRKEVADNPDYELTPQKIDDWEDRGRITPGCAVLLLTGWGKRFSDANAYRNPDATKRMHFPGFSSAAAKYLIEERRVAALGIDTLSIDPGRSEAFPVHKLALGHDLYLIENLKNLELLPPRGILLFCGPLPIQGGSGSPARVLAIVE
jgi:kynurenine formamidase